MIVVSQDSWCNRLRSEERRALRRWQLFYLETSWHCLYIYVLSIVCRLCLVMNVCRLSLLVSYECVHTVYWWMFEIDECQIELTSVEVRGCGGAAHPARNWELYSFMLCILLFSGDCSWGISDWQYLTYLIRCINSLLALLINFHWFVI